MKHAGVAVSVTTFTDVIAFFIGSNTVLPGLQSFCIYAAVAIFAIYALQITHFVAWFSLGGSSTLYCAIERIGYRMKALIFNSERFSSHSRVHKKETALSLCQV